MELLLEEFHEGRLTYTVETGLKQEFVLSGFIEDLEYGFMGDGPGRPGSAFHDKKVEVRFETPVDEEFLQSVSENRLGDSNKIGSGKIYGYEDYKYCGPNPCGLAFVRAALCGEKFERDDGEEFEGEPVTMFLKLPLDAYEAIRRQAKESYDSHRILSATMRLIGNALPPTGERVAELGLELKQLDTSKHQGYAIQSFEVFKTRYVDAARGRVKHISPKEGESYGLSLSVKLSSVRYERGIEQTEDTSITCLGFVNNAHGKPYQGVEVDVSFWEHETNRFGETPKQAYFGEFVYFPKEQEPKGLQARFRFDLRYMPTDASRLIQELVGPGSNSKVELSILLAVDEAAFDGSSKMGGNVRSYAFAVSQTVVDTDVENAATTTDVERLNEVMGEVTNLMESIRVENECKLLPDRPATKQDVELLRDAVAQINVVPVIAQLFEHLQQMNRRIGWIWWFSLGALVSVVACYLA